MNRSELETLVSLADAHDRDLHLFTSSRGNRHRSLIFVPVHCPGAIRDAIEHLATLPDKPLYESDKAA